MDEASRTPHRRRHISRELVAENEGSRARDHLANERTFLAWVRTGLALIVLGVAVARLLSGEVTERQVIGVVLVVAGAMIFAYATYRYYRVMRQLDRGVFGADQLGPIVIFGITLVASVGALVVVLV